MEQMFRIVFQGRVRQGLTNEMVKEQAALRLRISAAQAEKVFSGARVTLKQGLSAEQALLYQRTLEDLGMVVVVEAMPVAEAPLTSSPVVQAPATPPKAAAPEAPRIAPKVEGSARKVSDFERTHLNLSRAEALLNAANRPPVPPPPAPATPEPEHKKPSFGEGWLHVSGFDRLERTQQRLADAEALLLQSPAKPAIAQLVRQHARQTQPAPSKQRSFFTCSHCGTEHEIESTLDLKISARDKGQQHSG